MESSLQSGWKSPAGQDSEKSGAGVKHSAHFSVEADVKSISSPLLIAAGLHLLLLPGFGSDQFLRTSGGTSDDSIIDMTEDFSGNTYVLGTYSGSFRWGKQSAPLFSSSFGTQPDAFIAKVDSRGEVVWHHTIAGHDEGILTPTGIAIDGTSNVYVTGSFRGTATFYVTFSGGFPLPVLSTSTGAAEDGFVFSLDESGAPRWRATFRGEVVQPRGIAIGGLLPAGRQLMVAGDYRGTTSFHLPQEWPAVQVSTANSPDAFVVLLNPETGSTTQLATLSIGGTGLDAAHAVQASSEAIFLAGEFNDVVDFDPGAGTRDLSSDAAFSNGFLLILSHDLKFKKVHHFRSSRGASLTCLTRSRGGTAAGDFFAGGNFLSGLTYNENLVTAPEGTGCFAARIVSGEVVAFNAAVGESTRMKLTDISSDPSFGAVLVGEFSGAATFGGFRQGGFRERPTEQVAQGSDGFIWTLGPTGKHLGAFSISGDGQEVANAVTGDLHGFHSIAGTFGSGSGKAIFPFSRFAEPVDSRGAGDAFVMRRYCHPVPRLAVHRFGDAGMTISFKGHFGHTYSLVSSDDLLGSTLVATFPRVGSETQAWLHQNAVETKRQSFYLLFPGVLPEG